MMELNSPTKYFEKISVVRKLPYGRNKNRLLRNINRGDGGLVFLGSKTDINDTRGIMFLSGVSCEDFAAMVENKAIGDILSKMDKIYHVPSKRWLSWQQFSELEDMGWVDYIERAKKRETKPN